MSTATPTATTQAQNLYRKARSIIPGGTQLLSKRPEMFAPGQWPGYFKEARGVEVIDIDDRRYIDMTTMGIGACLLGYADPDVNQAVVDRVQRGSMSSLNPPEEVELAEMLLSLHPWAQMARFARGGGEAMSVAVRIARAFTEEIGLLSADTTAGPIGISLPISILQMIASKVIFFPDLNPPVCPADSRVLHCRSPTTRSINCARFLVSTGASLRRS